MQNGSIFKFFGILTFIFQLLVIFALILDNRRNPITFDTRFIIVNFTSFFFTTAIAIGLMFRKKWAAILFSLANLSIGLWLIVGTLLYVPLAWMIYNFILGAIFLVPSLVTLSFRAQLSGKEENML